MNANLKCDALESRRSDRCRLDCPSAGNAPGETNEVDEGALDGLCGERGVEVKRDHAVLRDAGAVKALSPELI